MDVARYSSHNNAEDSAMHSYNTEDTETQI